MNEPTLLTIAAGLVITGLGYLLRDFLTAPKEIKQDVGKLNVRVSVLETTVKSLHNKTDDISTDVKTVVKELLKQNRT